MSNYKTWLEYLDNEDYDAYAYFGPVGHDGYDALCASIPEEPRKKAVLILGTFGGDPDAGYRIARALMHHYGDHFYVLVPHFCKSAGTLICIGANTLLLANRSELGPLDIQLRKQDELFQQNSGLDIVRGIALVTENALDNFRDYLLEINRGSGMTTKSAAEITTRLVIGLYEPVFAQVDPIRLGETSAALQIAASYGERLNKKAKNLRPNALSKLIHAYPSHGFVIDRSEAKCLFHRVMPPPAMLDEISKYAEERLWRSNGHDLSMVYLNKIFAALAADEAQPSNEERNVDSGSTTSAPRKRAAKQADRKGVPANDAEEREKPKPTRKNDEGNAQANSSNGNQH